MENTQNKLGVISGDIVDSTKLDPKSYSLLLERIKKIQSVISEYKSDNRHDIVRGDEFQSVIFDYSNVLRYTVLYRVGIKALGKQFDSRISFSIANCEPVRESVSESTGHAFTLSGRGLKDLKSERLYFSSDIWALSAEYALYFKYLDKQLTDLTSRQSAIIFEILLLGHDLPLNILANKMNVTPPTISKSLKSSGFALINELMQRFQASIMKRESYA